MLHENDNRNDNDATTPLTVFGALSKVGDTHHQLKSSEANSTTFQNENLTEKQARRMARASIKERLQPHTILRNCDPQTYRSRVLRTENLQKNQHQHLDLDLGWSILEIRREDNKKRFCVFDSLEVSLLDEDAGEEEEANATS